MSSIVWLQQLVRDAFPRVKSTTEYHLKTDLCPSLQKLPVPIHPRYSGRAGSAALPRHGFQFHWPLRRDLDISKKSTRTGANGTASRRVSIWCRNGVSPFMYPESRANETAPRNFCTKARPADTVLARPCEKPARNERGSHRQFSLNSSAISS
jgi:hypothetical protein